MNTLFSFFLLVFHLWLSDQRITTPNSGHDHGSDSVQSLSLPIQKAPKSLESHDRRLLKILICPHPTAFYKEEVEVQKETSMVQAHPEISGRARTRNPICGPQSCVLGIAWR